MKSEMTLKNGMTCTIREAEPGDGELLLPFLALVAIESDNLTFGPGEFTPTGEEEEEFIRSCREKDNGCIFVAVIEGRIIGNLSFRGGDRKRNRHTGEMGVSVLKEFWGNGIATALVNRLLEWAVASPITKINLRVKEDNRTAITLYSKLGFMEEGRITRDFLIEGRYYDSVQMGICLD